MFPIISALHWIFSPIFIPSNFYYYFCIRYISFEYRISTNRIGNHLTGSTESNTFVYWHLCWYRSILWENNQIPWNRIRRIRREKPKFFWKIHIHGIKYQNSIDGTCHSLLYSVLARVYLSIHIHVFFSTGSILMWYIFPYCSRTTHSIFDWYDVIYKRGERKPVHISKKNKIKIMHPFFFDHKATKQWKRRHRMQSNEKPF